MNVLLLTLSRRRFMLAATGAASMPPAFGAAQAESPPAGLVALERRVGGRIGVFALDTGSGKSLEYRPDERFAMCSTFKWVLAAAVLARAEQQELSLDDRISFGPGDLLEYAPFAAEHLHQGFLTVGALARAAVVVSDNTAANLLLNRIGGPAAITSFARSLGDLVTRLDRDEPGLNSNEPGDSRDTTSPRAMVGLMRSVLLGNALTRQSRALLLDWLQACETGEHRLRAGLPKSWVVGDKTGTGRRRAVNDLAIATPPNRAPILIASYFSDSSSEASVLEAGQADVARWVASAFLGRR